MFDLIPEDWFDFHVEVYRPEDHYHVLGEEARFVPAPDPETEEDPEMAGMSWIERAEWIDDYERNLQEEWEYQYNVQKGGI